MRRQSKEDAATINVDFRRGTTYRIPCYAVFVIVSFGPACYSEWRREEAGVSRRTKGEEPVKARGDGKGRLMRNITCTSFFL